LVISYSRFWFLNVSITIGCIFWKLKFGWQLKFASLLSLQVGKTFPDSSSYPGSFWESPCDGGCPWLCLTFHHFRHFHHYGVCVHVLSCTFSGHPGKSICSHEHMPPLRKKKKICGFPVSSYKNLGRVGRFLTLFFNFFF
jgi:hypothetical protein